MEKRLLIAIVLSVLVLILYSALFVKKPPPPKPVLEPAAEVTEEPPSDLPPKQETAAPEPAAPVEFQPVAESSEQKISVETWQYRAVWSNRGAVLRSWRLKDFTDEDEEPLELVSTRSEELQRFPFALNTNDPEFDRVINTALYTASSPSLALEDGQSRELRFEFADDSGNRVEKTFIFEGGTFAFDIQVRVWKNGQPLEPRLVWGPGFGNPSLSELKRRFGASHGIAVYTAAKVYRQEEKRFKPEASVYNFVSWAAYEDNYFTALFLTSPQKTSAAFLKEEVNQSPYFFLSFDHPTKGYIGPKDIDALNEFGGETKKLIKFGLFGFIAELLLRAIKAVHNVFPNWGFSIILLTFIIKILFFPLTIKSTQSMAKMQELQPKIKALRAKYKKAKQDIAQRRKMNEEIMKLYKEQGVNPAGGCLPMLIQLPIFWGFFRMLLISIEFRKSPFLFWIKDLSIKDPLYVTPILMGITQFISQKMTPTSADPAQQRMMLIMPVVMTIFFMNFQSGLVLYWLTNNVLQIGQQYVMNRYVHKKKRESHGKRRKK